MSKVTWSVPLVQFGRFEVEFELEGAQNSPQELGRQYALFTADVMRGYEAEREKIAAELMKRKVARDLTRDTQENYNAPAEAPAEPTERKTKVGDTVTVAGVEFTKIGDSPFPEHNEPTEEEAQRLIKEGLGATVVGKAPVWDEPVEESPKPWKGSGPVKKITDIQF